MPREVLACPRRLRLSSFPAIHSALRVVQTASAMAVRVSGQDRARDVAGLVELNLRFSFEETALRSRSKSRWRDRFRKFGRQTIGFFGQVPGSVMNHLNIEELARITVASLCAGAGMYGVIHSVVLSADSIFPAPCDAALAATLLTMILEASRRLGHGADSEGNPPDLDRIGNRHGHGEDSATTEFHLLGRLVSKEHLPCHTRSTEVAAWSNPARCRD